VIILFLPCRQTLPSFSGESDSEPIATTSKDKAVNPSSIEDNLVDLSCGCDKPDHPKSD
jgi:hypothetical protein